MNSFVADILNRLPSWAPTMLAAYLIACAILLAFVYASSPRRGR